MTMTPSKKPKETKKEDALSFLRLVNRGKITEAYERYVSQNFRHHNCYYKGDAASLQKGMEENEEKFPDKVFEERRALEDSDLVVIHSRVRLARDLPEMSVVHIFRFDNGRILELWDIAQEVPTDSPNEYGAF